MKQSERITLAAIAVIMSLPMRASEVIRISSDYGVDHKEVMHEVDDMLKAGQVFESELEGGVK